MDLGTLRTTWVRESGRYDRVKTVDDDLFVDNGANAVLNRAIRFLDNQIEYPESFARFIDIAVTAGEFFVSCPDLRVVTDVWCALASDSTKWRLQPVDIVKMRTLYPQDLSLSTNGTPLYYCVAQGTLAPANKNTDFDDAVDHEDTFKSTMAGAGYRGVLIGPPTDSDIVVSLWGKFFPTTLSDDDEYNWWTVEHPQLVMEAASYIEECMLRNSTGQEDWLNAMKLKLNEIQNDYFEQESTAISDFSET